MVNWSSHDFGRSSKIFNIDHYKVKPWNCWNLDDVFEGVTLQRLTANPPGVKFPFMLSFANFDLHKGHANEYWALSKSDHNDDGGLPAYSHHDKFPPWWGNVSNDKDGNV